MSKITDAIKVNRKVLALAGVAFFSLTTTVFAAVFSSLTHKSVNIRTELGAVTIQEGNVLVPIPNTFLTPFIVGTGDTELFVVTFSAQAELQNSSSNASTFNADDVLDVRAQAVNNSTSAVVNFEPSFVAFASSNAPGTHSMTWARRLTTGSWNIRMVARVNDRAPTGTVRALISSRTMMVTRYE